MIYKLTTDFFGVGGWEVEGIIYKVELTNPRFSPKSDPLDDRLRSMSPDPPAFNGPCATITTGQGTSSSSLNWHPEFFFLRGCGPEVDMRKRQSIQVFREPSFTLNAVAGQIKTRQSRKEAPSLHPFY
jgi:hypothetical protein